MKLKGKLTLLSSEDGVELELIDTVSSVVMVRIDIPADKFCAMMGRLGMVDVEMMVGELHKVGKKMEMDTLTFEMPKKVGRNTVVAKGLAMEKCPEGWEPDCYFGSQDSFTYDPETEIYTARTTIRRWVDK